MIDIERIMISGVGILSPTGITSDTFFNSLLAEQTVQGIEDEAYPGHGGDKETARLTSSQKEAIDLEIGVLHLPQTIKYGIYAVKMALKDSGLSAAELMGKRVSVIIGSNDAESETFDDYIKHQRLDRESGSGYHIANEISAYFGFKGMSFCVHNACASSNMAMDMGLSILRKGQSDIVIAGGADSFSLRNYSGFNSLGAISKTSCTPFSALRDGILITEGAGIAILEKEGALLARQKQPYCEVLGAGSSNDGFHLTKPSQEGIMLAVKKGLEDAQISSRDVRYIMAHGTGTVTNDQTESAVIRAMYPDNSLKGVCSIKGTVGHMMGAAGSVATVAICLIYQKGMIPAAKKALPLAAECGINIVTEKIEDEDIGIFVNHSFGFGGNNSILVLGPSGNPDTRGEIWH